MAMAKRGRRGFIDGGGDVNPMSFVQYVLSQYPHLSRPSMPTPMTNPPSSGKPVIGGGPSTMSSGRPTIGGGPSTMSSGRPYGPYPMTTPYPFSNGSGNDIGDWVDQQTEGGPGAALIFDQLFGGGSERGIGHPARRRGK